MCIFRYLFFLVQRAGEQRRRRVERLLAAQHLLDFPVAADDEGDAIGVALLPHAIRLGHAAVLVRQQREGQLQALGKLLLRVDVVGGDAQDLGIGVGELRGDVAKSRQLFGSTTGEGLGKEGQHDGPLAFELLQRNGLTIGRGPRKFRRRLSGWQRTRDRKQRSPDEKQLGLHAPRVHC